MSVEYDLVCHQHKERFWVCSDGLSGPTNQLSNNKALASFIVTHRNCGLKVIDEHNDDFDDYKTWEDGEWRELLRYDI